MLKRVLLFTALAFCVSCVVFLIWQPASLKTKVFNYAAAHIPASVPFDVRIGQVSGSWLTGFSFTDVQLLKKQNSQELLRIKRVSLGLSWSALLFHKKIQIKRLTVYLGDGEATLKGLVYLEPIPSGQFVIEDENFPLEKMVVLSGETAPAFSLVHSGHWKIRLDSQTVSTEMEGRLQAGPQVMSVHWNTVSQGLRLNGHAQIASTLATIHIRFHQGIGDFDATLGPPEFKSHLQGQINLLDKSVHGQGSAEEAAWGAARLGKCHYRFGADSRNQRIDIMVNDLQWQKGIPKANDITSAHLVLNGLSPQWQVSASVVFRNGATVDTSGALTHENEFTRFTWQKLAMAFSTAGTWTAQHPGAITFFSSHRVALHGLTLANGAQYLEISQGERDANQFSLALLCKELDPAPWAKLFAPDVLLEGTLNASLKIHGTPSDLGVGGFLNGQFQKLNVTSIGLALQNIDMQLRSSNQRLEVVRFVGKTKKGDFQMSGSSILPKLAFVFHAHHIELQPFPHSKAILDADLDLEGTGKSPVLTGRLFITEGSYTVPKKEDQKSSSATTLALWDRQSRLDIKIEWPRNVWYHEGASNIETKGDLRVQKPVDSTQVILTGTITSLRGTYNYYGRDFTIESGQLQFVGTPEINPAMTIEASYTSGPTTVYLDMSGTLEKPVLKMHSNPPLPQQDIISVIVFGQPLNTLRTRSGSTTSNQEMMQAVGGVLGSYVSKGLNQTGISALNFDVLNIQSTDQGGSQLMMGRYLTRRLFVNYGQSVRGSAEKTITADYFLTDKWTLQGVSDSLEGNYMDFLFRYPLNKRGAPVNTSPLPRSPFRNSLDSPALQQQFRTPLQ